jgi:predicted nucleotidyltransferase
MEKQILNELMQLEREKGIDIINARERGSRMLGAEHEESDWDILFLFSQPAHRYATIHGHIDSIHDPHLGADENIDLHGWNVDKFAGLLHDSNPNAIEYCREDAKEYIRFQGDGTFEDLTREARENFNHMSLYHHYRSMAKRNWKKYIKSGNDCTKGRQFYVARSLGAAQFIRCKGELPPMDARDLTDELHEHNETLASTLGFLTREKREGRGDEENEDIVGRLYKAEAELEPEPTDERTNKPAADIIDQFVVAAIQ